MTVIDFRLARNKLHSCKAVESIEEVEIDLDTFQDKYENWKQDSDDAENATLVDFNKFETWMNTAKRKARAPGFEGVNEVIAYLLVDTELPIKINRRSAINWYSGLDEDERAKCRMIDNHAPRLLQVFETIKVRLHAMMDKWKNDNKGMCISHFETMNGAVYFDMEFSQDIKHLKDLMLIFDMLGR